ncbi:hypothetical protein KUV62_02935 [Salipiger bermudensis]|uniref:hypothetical protein n=1 Tax=Salipiger bermudensis TaxID=344736 RepID=UPI001C99170A|nr:hypothetical protein [Salipiger bermudensis]MBY6002844.1 hypothetical protein [Salipiger bermudensis]
MDCSFLHVAASDGSGGKTCAFLWVEFARMVAQITLPIVAGVVAWATFRLNKAKRLDALNAQLAELHDHFWREPDMARVREIIMVDLEYGSVQAAFENRLEGRQFVSSDDYQVLEKVDRYVNFVLRVDAVTKRYQKNGVRPNDGKFVEEVLFEYWLRQIVVRKRYALFAYVITFFFVIPATRGPNKNDKEPHSSFCLLYDQLCVRKVLPGGAASGGATEEEYQSFTRALVNALRNRKQLPEKDATLVPDPEDGLCRQKPHWKKWECVLCGRSKHSKRSAVDVFCSSKDESYMNRIEPVRFPKPKPNFSRDQR